MRAQLRLGRARAAQRAAELPHRVRDDAADEVLLVREVIVERGDVDTDSRRYLPRAQPLKAACGEFVVCGRNERIPPRFGSILPGLTFNQSDD